MPTAQALVLGTILPHAKADLAALVFTIKSESGVDGYYSLDTERRGAILFFLFDQCICNPT